MLLSPMMMLIQSRFVADVLIGRDFWLECAKPAMTRRFLLRAARMHAAHVAAGIGFEALSLPYSWAAFLWLLPIAACADARRRWCRGYGPACRSGGCRGTGTCSAFRRKPPTCRSTGQPRKTSRLRSRCSKRRNSQAGVTWPSAAMRRRRSVFSRASPSAVTVRMGQRWPGEARPATSARPAGEIDIRGDKNDRGRGCA